ncbi:sigma-70 family RNA polymerase sigma factor [Lentzea sp. NBRC 102530]|uniref:sigma-70 family RNA polymerase sigma factor n=1 Tax=Lentzea sp. NBRC 102530 TaxID=3032201 RepID=UPI002553A7D5|nr:sigma-70 family RNA polymerase sigma factor [Lentzea sp. NBRC 102530]
MRLMRPSWEGAAAVPGDAPSDAELWARGDEHAFGELYDRYAEAVWNHAYRLTASWATAEDLTSATFMTAWRRRAQVTLVRDSALPWLFTVAGNLARSEFRRKARFTRLLLRVPRDDVQDDHADAIVSSLDHESRLSEVLRAVERLPRAEREAVELVLLGELSAAEAAEALGVAEVSVRSRLSRARSRLRKLLSDDTLEVE